MFGFAFGRAKSDSENLKLILVCEFSTRIDNACRIDSKLKLRFVAFASKRDFNTHIFCLVKKILSFVQLTFKWKYPNTNHFILSLN
jgi:hypothetical protein